MSSLPFSQACENNKRPILAILETAFADVRQVLEVGSGTGQHAEYFAAHLPHCHWQCTDRPEWLAGLQARIAQAALPNLPPPLKLDVRETWPASQVEAVFSANTLHIMHWPEVEAFFQGVGQLLQAGGVCCIYGPFNYQGNYTSDSNAAFDQMLRRRDPGSGLRDIDDITSLAAANGLQLSADHAMPANNRLLVFYRQ